MALHAGVSHKALIPLGGRTLVARVLESVASAGAARIVVSANDPAIEAELAKLSIGCPVTRVEASASPSLSVREAAARLDFPILVTTCDHALLEPEWVRRFLADAPQDADICALLAEEPVVRAAAPDTQRTYLTFRDGAYSGCNLFLLQTERGLAAVDLWRKVEAHRKQPWRVAAILGPVMLAGFALKGLTLDQAVAALGRRAGVQACAVRTPYGLAAVDVDKPVDLDLVRRLVEP